MQKVYLEIDARTGALKAKLNTSSGDVKTWALEAEKSGKRAAKGIDETTKAADRLGGSLTNVKGLLASAFTAAGIVAAGKNISRTADAVAEMEGRLKVATRTQAEFNAAQDEVVNISKRSATRIGETVNLYSRLSVALRETELAQRDIFRITETVNKAFTVSGATTVEATNAIRQLSQGMASGILRGEEYNALTEQGDRIVQALADTLNKTRGELRAMANDGKLSAEIVTNAILQQSNAIDAEYSEFPVTVARAITLMSNSWTNYIANSETAREVSENVAQSIVFLSENIETLIDGVLIATQVAVALAGARGLKALTASLVAARAAMAAATTTTYSYSAAMGAARVSTTAFGTAVKTVGGFLKNNALGIAIFGGIELIQFIGDLIDKVEEVETPVTRVNDAFAEGFSVEALITAGAEVDNLKARISDLNVQLEQNGQAMGQAALDAADLRTGWNSTLRANVNLRNSLQETEFALTKATWADRLATAVSVADGVITVFKDNYKTLTTEVEESNKAIDRWIASTEKQTQKLANSNEAFGQSKARIVQLEAAQLKATTTNKKYHVEIDRVTAAKVKQIEISEGLKTAQDALNEATREALALAEQYVEDTDPIGAAEELRKQRIEQIELALSKGTITQTEYANAMKGADKIVEDAEKGLQKYEDRVRSADDVLEDLGLTSVRLDADIALLRSGLDAAKTALDFEKVELYAQALARLGAEAAIAGSELRNIQGINAASGGLNNAASFEGLIEQGLTLKDIFATMATSMGEGAAGIANAVNVGIQGIQFLQGIWDSTAGQDGAGRILDSISQVAESGALGQTAQAIAQVARTINELTGGKLFGTSFETTGGATNFNIGSEGVFGSSETFQERERSLFRGTQRRTIVEALTGEALQALTEVFNSIETGIASLARGLGTSVPEIIAGSFAQELDKEGNVISETSTILGREYAENFSQFSTRLLAENLIAVLDQVLPQVETQVQTAIGGYDFEAGIDLSRVITTTRLIGEATALAEEYRARGADALLEFAQFATLAVADLQDSTAILGSLTAITEITEELAIAGESLSETYARLRGSVQVTDEALGIMGISLDLSREAYIAFAAEITNAAGGLDRATELWRNFFEGFYSPAELADIRLEQARGDANSQLEGVGFDANTGLAEFREAFEAVFAELSPEDVVTWLEAGNALATYNELLAEQVSVQIEAAAALSDAVRDVNNDVLGLLRTGFQSTLAEIEAQERETINTLNDLAVAAGRAEASEEALGQVHLRTALQTQQAINQLRSAAEGLINELYGDQLDQRIAELEAIQNNGANNVGTAAENTYERQLALIRRIRDVIDSTLIDERLSPLTRTEQLSEGVSQFQELIALANTGDLEAQAQLPALYQELLGIGRDVFASGQGYTDLYAQLTGLLETVAPTGSASSGPATVVMLPSAELTALYAERDARLAEQTAAERLELAAQLSTYLVDLAGALNTPLLEIAEELGLNMSALVTDLGVNLSNISVETVNQLANVSNSLGISLATLTDSLGEEVGAELGNLANAQSLLNDALEGRINALPAEFRNNLAPLLTAVENAADGTARDAALLALESATSDLPIEQRNALAPFFENIDPVSELQEQILIANRMETAAEARRLLLSRQLTTLTEVRNNLRAQNDGQGLPSYAVGSTNIPYDQVANIHKGEIIMTAQEAAIMRKYFGGGGNVSSSSGTMDNLMRELIGVVKSGALQTNRNLEGIKDATENGEGLYTDRLTNETGVNSSRSLAAAGDNGCGGGYI